MRLVGIGQSHIWSIRNAENLTRSFLEGSGIEIDTLLLRDDRFKPWKEWVTEGKRGGYRLVSVLRDEIKSKIVRADLIFSCIGGNGHNIFGLVNHARPFDFVLEEMPDLPLLPGREVVPARLVESALKAHSNFQDGQWFLRAVRGLIDGPIVHCESPPPCPSENHIMQHPNVFRDQLVALGVAPPTLRYKLWRLQSRFAKQDCSELGIQFLPAPPETMDTEGFLVPKAWYRDPVHAGQWYGQRVIEQLVRLKDPSFTLPEAS